MGIKELEHNKTYKYLEIDEANGSNHAINKEKEKKRILYKNKSY